MPVLFHDLWLLLIFNIIILVPFLTLFEQIYGVMYNIDCTWKFHGVWPSWINETWIM